MDNTRYSEYALTAINAAMLAGNYLRQGFQTSMDIGYKEGKHNLVTNYDIGAEKKIIEYIKKSYPNHTFLAEESGLSKSSGDTCWIIDPLDGTVNFAHGIPFFAVSIGVEIAKELVCGVVFQPMTQELFIAEKGKGAYFNGRKISVTKTEEIDQAFLATGFPYDVANNPNHCIEKFNHILQLGIPVRRLGVASLDLAYVACGRFDGFFEVSLSPWDCAAGILLIEEANGVVTQWDNTPFDIHGYKPILASNSKIHGQLTKTLSGNI